MHPSGLRAGPDRQWDFGGLKMVVRFEVDACLPFRTTRSHRNFEHATNKTRRTRDTKPTPSRSAWEVDTPLPSIIRTVKKPTLRFPRVAVIRAGSRVPQSHLIELKTYSKAGKEWSRSYPQLFLSQTPHIYYGVHKNGRISEIKKFSLGEPHLRPIDQNAQVGFKKLEAALATIQALVVKYGRTDGRTDKPRLQWERTGGVSEAKYRQLFAQVRVDPFQILAFLQGELYIFGDLHYVSIVCCPNQIRSRIHQGVLKSGKPQRLQIFLASIPP
jgi:hypothetical protein